MAQTQKKSCWCGRKVNLGRSMQETGPVTPASRLAQVSRMISCVMSSGLTRLSQLILSASAVSVVPLSVSPSPLGGLFLFLEKCPSVATKETVGLLWEDKWSEEWLRGNLIRLMVAKLFWDDGRLPWMFAVLCVTGVGFLICLLAPESSLVNPISECESASHHESEFISTCAESGLQLRAFVWGGEGSFLESQ